MTRRLWEDEEQERRSAPAAIQAVPFGQAREAPALANSQLAAVARHMRGANRSMSAAVLARRGREEAYRPNEPVHQDQARRMPDHELFEVFAKDFAYHDVLGTNPDDEDLDGESINFLRAQGYRIGSAVDTELTSMEAVSFIPTDRSRRPVVAFRGSADRHDWMYNLGSNNDPGVVQSTIEAGPVTRLIEGASEHGPVVLTGHSLGGSMAQLFAAGCYDLIGEVVTFNSPGVPELIAQYVQGLNAASGHELSTTHYRMDGDVVDDLGASFLPGTAVDYHDDSIDATPGIGPLDIVMPGASGIADAGGDLLDAHLSMMLNVDDQHAGEVHRRGSHRTGPGAERRTMAGGVDAALDAARFGSAASQAIMHPFGAHMPQTTRQLRDEDARRFLEQMARVRATRR